MAEASKLTQPIARLARENREFRKVLCIGDTTCPIGARRAIARKLQTLGGSDLLQGREIGHDALDCASGGKA